MTEPTCLSSTTVTDKDELEGWWGLRISHGDELCEVKKAGKKDSRCKRVGNTKESCMMGRQIRATGGGDGRRGVQESDVRIGRNRMKGDFGDGIFARRPPTPPVTCAESLRHACPAGLRHKAAQTKHNPDSTGHSVVVTTPISWVLEPGGPKPLVCIMVCNSNNTSHEQSISPYLIPLPRL